MPAAYDPSEARLRIAIPPVGNEDHLDHGAPWQDHRFTSEELGLEQTLIESASLNPGGQRTQGTPGKIRTGPAPINVELEPEGLAAYFALFQRFAKTPEALAAGAWRHWLSPTAADIDHRSRRLQAQIYRDDTAIQGSYGASVAGFSFSTQVDQLWTGNVDIVAARSDYSGAATQTTGAGSTLPQIRGLARLDVLEGVAKVRLQVTDTAPAVGDFEVAVALDDDAIGAVHVAVTANQWNRAVLSSDGSGLGAAPSHVEIRWTDGSVAVGDVFEIPVRVASPWVSSLPTVRGLSEVETDIYIDGTRLPIPITSLSLAGSHTAEPDEGIGGVWPVGTIATGLRQITWNLDRRMTDNFLQRRLEAGRPLHLDVVITSPVLIGASTVPYRARFVSPNCLLSGKRPTVTDPNTQRESYQLNAFPAVLPDAEGFVDDLTVVLDNGTAFYG